MSETKKDFEELLRTKLGNDATKDQVVVAEDPWKPEDVIPGFEKMTLQVASYYEVKWSMIPVLRDARQKYFQATIVPTSIGLHIVRGFSRLEWRELQRKILEKTEALYKAHKEADSNALWADRDAQFGAEEMTTVAGCVHPAYDRDTIRDVPAGVVNMLSDACIVASGFPTDTGTLPPLKL